MLYPLPGYKTKKTILDFSSSITFSKIFDNGIETVTQFPLVTLKIVLFSLNYYSAFITPILKLTEELSEK